MAFIRRTEPPTRNNRYYFADNPFEQSGYGMPNCTAYAFGRFWEITGGSKPKLSLGNAGGWFDYSDGYDRGQTPRLGAVAVWSSTVGDAGHVAIVEHINGDGSYIISQSGWQSTFWWESTIPASNYYNSSYKFEGFIYNPSANIEPIVSNSYLSLSEMQNNAIYIYYYLISKGWTLEAIAGMLGNMQSESTINSGIWENLDEGNTSGGFGLVQWTPATKLIEWCNSKDYEYDSMDAQLERIVYEVANGLQWISTAEYIMSFEDFTKSTKSAGTLAAIFQACYERPAILEPLERSEQGNYWYDFLNSFSGTDPEPTKRNKKKQGFNFLLFNRTRRKQWTLKH